MQVQLESGLPFQGLLLPRQFHLQLMCPLKRILNILHRLEVRPYHCGLLVRIKVPRLCLDFSISVSVSFRVFFGVILLLILIGWDVELLES